MTTPPHTPSTTPPLSALLETSLYVAALAPAVAFYERLFALPTLMRDARMCALAVGEHQVLLLFVHGGSAATIRTPGGTIPPHDGSGTTHVAFAIPAAALTAWEAHLARCEVPVEGRVHWPRGGVSLYFRDPDSHLIELATPGVWTVY